MARLPVCRAACRGWAKRSRARCSTRRSRVGNPWHNVGGSRILNKISRRASQATGILTRKVTLTAKGREAARIRKCSRDGYGAGAF